MKNLKSLRNKKKLSLQALVNELGISSATSMQRFETGQAEADFKTLIVLADYFETSVDYLIGHTKIRQKIENIMPKDLTNLEQDVLENIRKLSPTAQQKALRIVKIIAEIE